MLFFYLFQYGEPLFRLNRLEHLFSGENQCIFCSICPLLLATNPVIMELWSLVFALFSLLTIARAAFTPVGLRSIDPLRPRNTNDVRREINLLRPRSQVELFYAESRHLLRYS
jgi:hypothetical protein